MIRNVRLVLLAGVMLTAVLVLIGTTGRGRAAGPTAEWRLYARANTTTFAAGGSSIAAPGNGAGYEIVSFDAVPLSTGLATYRYGGPDLPPPRGPMPAIVSCTASFTSTGMSLQVTGAYPYAGCVFFLGVTNIGTGPIQVQLGGLDGEELFGCDTTGCEISDLDIVAGGLDAATVAALCTESGGDTVAAGGLRYSIPVGGTFVCPLFLTVLQPANELTNYEIEVVRGPGPDPSPSPTSTSTRDPLRLQTPTPTNTPTNTPVPGQTPIPTTTASPTRQIDRTDLLTPTPPAGSTPGGSIDPGGLASPTPLPPVTGSGILAPGHGGRFVPAFVILALSLLAAGMIMGWPRRR